MFEAEPELITIIEGPSPDFHPSPYLWFQSVFEGPEDAEITMCELRTFNGDDIIERCRSAWDSGRTVKLDYPDHMRLRKQIDVVAMRLQEEETGPMLVLWVRQLMSELREEELDDGDEDLSF